MVIPVNEVHKSALEEGFKRSLISTPDIDS
jgi:hypothetical protein